MAITKRQAAELAKQTFDYAPAPEAIDHVRIQPRYGLFIGGKMIEPHSKKRFPTINPATEQKLAEVAEADAVDVGRAVAAAGVAFTSWSRMAPSRRARYLFRISRHPGTRARARGHRDDGRRQADQGVPRRRRPAERGPLLLLRRLG